MTKRVASGSSSRILEFGCWGLGALLITVYVGARAYGESERLDGLQAFSEARANLEAQAGAAPQPMPDPGASPSPHVSAGRLAVLGDGAPVERRTDRPAAILRIDRIGLEVPVYADVSERNLNRGAGLIAGTGLPGDEGNVGIAAHRDSYFRVLKDVAVGDLIALESLAGIRRYRITELFVVEPDDLKPLHEVGAPVITLVTCYPFYFVGAAPQRFIVRAVATE
jgi:LPXTG-site transpeptidase (sortase) family protein